MKDLKIFYITECPKSEPILSDFDKEIEKIARKNGLEFSGSGVEIGTGIRDIHYRRKNEKEG